MGEQDHMTSRDHAQAASGVREPGKAKRPKPACGMAWGILNPFGDLWTHETFLTPEAATAFVAAFWAGFKDGADPALFRPVRVRVTVSALSTASPAERPVTGPGMPTNDPGQALAEAEGTKP